MSEETPQTPRIREVVKARIIAGVVCITLPKSVRLPLQIEPGSRVIIEAKEDHLTVRKE